MKWQNKLDTDVIDKRLALIVEQIEKKKKELDDLEEAGEKSARERAEIIGKARIKELADRYGITVGTEFAHERWCKKLLWRVTGFVIRNDGSIRAECHTVGPKGGVCKECVLLDADQIVVATVKQ